MGKCDTRQGQFRQHVQAEYIPACASGLLSYDHEYAMLNTLTRDLYSEVTRMATGMSEVRYRIASSAKGSAMGRSIGIRTFFLVRSIPPGEDGLKSSSFVSFGSARMLSVLS